MPHDRHAEAETAMRAGHRAVGLRKPVEDMPQKGRRDALAVVGYGDPKVGAQILHSHVDATVAR